MAAESKKVIVCDDEENARRLLCEYMTAFPQLEVIKECGNGIDAVQAINDLQPGLVFLDIQMPGLSGFQVLEQIVHTPQIIFSTAFDAYAIKAFDSNAVDYLLKPYTRQRFMQAVNKVLVSSQNINHQVQSLGKTLPEKVLVQSGKRMVSLFVKDILWVEAQGDFTKLHTAQKFYISCYGLNELEQKLNGSVFLRIHRSAIINVKALREVYRNVNGYYVVLLNGFQHKVGRSYIDVIKTLSL